MNLTVLERVMILKALPKEGDYASLKIMHNLRMSLAFTEEEATAWSIVSDVATGRMSWKINEEVEIPIGERANDIIVLALKKLNREKKLTADMMSVYEKFIPVDDD